MGGRLRHFSKHPVRYQAVDLGLEAQRPATRRYAWFSLFSVALVDLYIYLLATGAIDDVRFF